MFPAFLSFEFFAMPNVVFVEKKSDDRQHKDNDEKPKASHDEYERGWSDWCDQSPRSQQPFNGDA